MRLITVVALALVMLWVPVDGAAQGVGLGAVGDWILDTSVDPFTDEKSTSITLSHFLEPEDGFRSISIECGNNGLRFVFMTEALPSDVGPTYPLTYRLGDAPAKDVLARVGANVPKTSPGPYAWLDDVGKELSQAERNLRDEGLNFALLIYSPLPSEALALISSPRVAFKIGIYMYTRRHLAGTNEAVRPLHCVQ
jgi:hypothetical protein